MKKEERGIKELYGKIMALDGSMFDINEDDVEQHAFFDPSRYPEGENGPMYMPSPSSSPSPSRIRTHDRKH